MPVDVPARPVLVAGERYGELLRSIEGALPAEKQEDFVELLRMVNGNQQALMGYTKRLELRLEVCHE